MKKILFVSLNEPDYTGGKGGGPVILIHNILSALPKNQTVDLLVYKKEELENNLGSNVNCIPWSKLTRQYKSGSWLRLIPKSMFSDYSCFEIDANGYEKIIFYPYFSSLFKLKNCCAECYTIGMDSGPMLYLRGFVNHKSWITKMFCGYEFLQALSIDRHACELSKKVFTVGESDAEFYRSVYLADAHFVPHPATDLVTAHIPCGYTGKEKLKLCFPGGMTRFYVSNLLIEIFDLMIKNADELKAKIAVSFLGKVQSKELEEKLNQLANVGIETEKIAFAEDFEEYLSHQNIILMPLEVGAGTKNKSLSALKMGLDLIGTPIALENVYGCKKEYLARTADEFISQIRLRLDTGHLFNLTKEEIKEFGTYHSIAQWTENFWNEVI